MRGGRERWTLEAYREMYSGVVDGERTETSWFRKAPQWRLAMESRRRRREAQDMGKNPNIAEGGESPGGGSFSSEAPNFSLIALNPLQLIFTIILNLFFLGLFFWPFYLLKKKSLFFFNGRYIKKKLKNSFYWVVNILARLPSKNWGK